MDEKLNDFKRVFQESYGKTLAQSIKDHTSKEEYQGMLLALIGA